MSSTFWINSTQLDTEQRRAVESIPETTSFVLKGPAGSGKTNILLLRAKWLTLKKMTNYKIIVFTGSLREFVQEGCNHYDIDPSSVITQMTFFRNILQEYSIAFDLSNNFETDRNLLAGKVMSLIESGRISNSFCETLLVDEAQDYTDTELRVFRGLTKNLVLAVDTRQSIYNVTHTPGLLEALVGSQEVNLRFHYRSGLKLCKLADAILIDSAAYPRVQSECHYDEGNLPSSVTQINCNTLDEQFIKIVENLELQVPLYPGEKIGVLFPKKEQVDRFSYYLMGQSIANPDNQIRVDTLHGAKGWEFRAVHVGGCEDLSRMGPTQKRLIYTGVLRGKTSAHVYYSLRIPGYLEAALATLNPPVPNPPFDELF